MAKFEYFEKTITIKKCTLEGTKSILNSRNACKHSVRNDRLPACNLRISMKAYKTKFCIIFYIGVKLVSQIQGRTYYRACSIMVGLKKIFGPKREELTECGENRIMRSCMICTLHLTHCGPKVLQMKTFPRSKGTVQI